MRLLLILLAGLLLAVAPVHAEPRYGRLHVFKPDGEMRDFVILFSQADTWGAEDEAAAQSLRKQGVMVQGVDSGPYLEAVKGTPCNLMDGDSESLAREVQRQLGTQRYHTAILAGIGAGGMLAERVMALAPPNSMAGAVSLDPVGSPALDANGCGADAKKLEGFWTVGASPGWSEAGQLAVAATGLHPELRRFGEKQKPGEMLAALVMPHLAPPAGGGEDVSDLPLVELPSKAPSDMLAIVLAGDGGWRDIDKRIGEDLQKSGINVVGLDSLRYFWTRVSPDRTAADVSRIIRSYTAKWHAKHVALIGYSFGADVLPFVYTRLPKEQQDMVRMVSLLAFSKGADFEIRVVGWLGAGPSAQALPTIPEVKQVPPGVVQCFYGADEANDTACRALDGTAADVVETAGSHHFDGNYEKLAQRILSVWRERIR